MPITAGKNKRIATLSVCEKLSGEIDRQLSELWVPLAASIIRARQFGPACYVVGMSGPQGCGKSTGASILKTLLENEGAKVAVLSLDYFYLPRLERLKLAHRVHPLLATRGPPGSHDLKLLTSVLDKIRSGDSLRVPRFSKASDDRLSKDEWPIEGPSDIVLFEGWCVGAKPQSEEQLERPLNGSE